MSTALTALGLFALQVSTVVPERALRAEPAGVAPAGHVEMAVGFWHARSARPDSVGTPARITWAVSPAWQIRVHTAGFVGQSLARSELRDGQFGAQFQFLGVGRTNGLDGAVRARIGCCPKKKQRAILTGLLSRERADSSIGLNVEVTIPFNEQSRGQIPLTGTLAFGARRWWSSVWGAGAGYSVEFPEDLRARHRFEATGLVRLSDRWVLDFGAEHQFTPWSRFVARAGISFYIASL